MSKKKKIVVGVLVILVLIIGIVFYISYEVNRKNSDGYRFKNEYESLNDTIRESDGAKYNFVSIDEDNPIKYVSISEALRIMDEEDAIIYVGANWCPWCRNAVPILLDVAKKYDVSKIYYLRLDDDKSTFEVQNDKVVETKHGSDDYYKLLDRLKDVLEDYTLNDSKGKPIKTGEKRIYMPFVIGFKDKKIVGSHVGTVDLDENQTKYDEMSSEQRLKLNDIYSNLFVKVFVEPSNTCDSEGCE